MLLEITAFQGKRFPDELVDVERSSCPDITPEVRANAFYHLSRAMAISGDKLERFLGSIEIGRRAIKKAKARISTRDHCGQRLFDLVSNRGRDRVPGHQPRLALATLGKDRAEQPRIKRRYLVQQDDQDENAG